MSQAPDRSTSSSFRRAKQPLRAPARTPNEPSPIAAKRTMPWPAIIIAAVTIIPAVIGGLYQIENRGQRANGPEFGQLLWRYLGVQQAVVAPPAVSAEGDLVYVAPAEGDGLVAVETESSRLRWAGPVGGVTAGPVVAGEFLYVANLTGILFALDPQTGVERWRVTAGGTYEGSPAVADGTLYIGNRDGHLYALDAGTGQERWRVDAGAWVDGIPVVAGGAVLVANADGTLLALDAATGQEHWRVDLGAGAIPSPAADAALGIVAAVDGTGTLRALDLATGDERWSVGPASAAEDDDPAGRTAVGPPAIGRLGDGSALVLVGTQDARMLALDATTGEERWHSVGSTLTPGETPVLVDDTVYLVNADTGVFAFAAADGDTRWLFEAETRGESLSALTVTPDGSRVYLSSNRGILRALAPPASSS